MDRSSMRFPRAQTVLVLCVGVCALVVRAQVDDYPAVGWQELTNGHDLSGWHIAPNNGSALFEYCDGTIVGTTIAGERITYLETERMYGDFVLECEFLIPEGMNAGIQFRSHSFAEYRGGNYFGYQYEMVGTPSDHEHRWTGGVIDEVRRNWIGPVVNRTRSENPLRIGDWNQARVLAIGGHIQTWLNGVPIVELNDRLTPAGHIALQLHDSLRRSGDQIRWRNIRIKDLDRASWRVDEARVVGPWKGATSNAGVGIYADVELHSGVYTARLYEDPKRRRGPLALLTGRSRNRAIVFVGEGWTGFIEHGVFRGHGRARRADVIEHTVTRSDQIAPLSFVMMPGQFEPVSGGD